MGHRDSKFFKPECVGGVGNLAQAKRPQSQVGSKGLESRRRNSTMSAVSIRTNLRVENILTQLTSTGTSFINPPIYLWSVFFKIDGTTAKVVLAGAGWKLQGGATVVGTPGNQGDLPGGIRASFFQ